MLKLILFPIICGIVWCWRGYNVPKLVHGYARAFLSAFMIIGLYCLWFTEQSVFNINPMVAVLVLTGLESALGYGKTCEVLDTKYFITATYKEAYAYLGFISLSYYLFPYMILQPYKSPVVYLAVAILGFIVFPLAKYLQLKVFNGIAERGIIITPSGMTIKLPAWLKIDAWKIVEAILGMGFVLWLIK